MKKNSIRKDSVRSVLSFALVGVLIGVAYFANPTFLKTPSALSAMSDNVYGYAWSENIGWLSLNDVNEAVPYGGAAYGVNIEQSSGNFSGYAWSENIGWIKFDPAGPYPSAPLHGAQLNTATKVVTGWARACAGTVNGDCTSASRTDGWDGWIKLSKDSADGATSPAYNVAITAGKFSGYAWGSDVVGWIDFGPTVSGVFVGGQVSFTPTPTICTASSPDIEWSGSCAPTGSCSAPQTTASVSGIESGTCTSGGTATKACTVVVQCSQCPSGEYWNGTICVVEPPPSSVINLTAFPTFMTPGNRVAIIYSTNGDTVSCQKSGQWGTDTVTVSSTEKTEQDGPLNNIGTYTYGLTCGGKYYYALVNVNTGDPFCGDGQCNGNETKESCPADCGKVTPGKPKTGQF